MADVETESTGSESETGSDSEDEDYGKLVRMIGCKTSSWGYIAQSIKNCQSTKQELDSSTIFLAAQQAFICDDVQNAIKLFGLAFDQLKIECGRALVSSNNKNAPESDTQNFSKAQLLEFQVIIGLSLSRCSTRSYTTVHRSHFQYDAMTMRLREDLTLSINCILSGYKKLGIEDAMLWSQASAFFMSCGDYDLALDLSKRALELDPLSIFAQEVYENICCHLVERWHFTMLNDKRRNQSYETAIIKSIDQYKDSVSLCDVGCGTGLLSLMASNQPNCSAVYAIEKMNTMAGIARKVFYKNLRDENARKIKLINKSSSQMSIPTDLPHHAEILVTEIFDAGLFGEGILPTLCHAWSNLLKQKEKGMGSLVIPSSAKLFVIAIESAAVVDESRVASDAHFYCLKHSNLCICSSVGMCSSDPYTTHDLKRLPGGYQALSEPCLFMEVDFNNFQELRKLEKGTTRNFSLTVTKAGRLDALAMWFSLCLLDTEQISTHTDCHSCWEQAVFPVNPTRLKRKSSLTVESGDKLQITQFVRGAQHLMIVTDIHSPSPDVGEIPNHGRLDKDTACLPLVFPEDALEWCKSETFCLDGSEIYALNNHKLSQALCCQLCKLLPRRATLQSHLIHLNSGFSPLCLQALSLGYTHAWAMASSAVHKVLMWKLAQENDVDLSYLTLLEDVAQCCLDIPPESPDHHSARVDETTTSGGNDNLVEGSNYENGDGSTSTNLQPKEQNKFVIVVDIVDWQGRLVEDLNAKISTLRCKIPVNCEIDIVPHRIDVYGVLIESEELLLRSRVISDEPTLGYKIATFINKFSTRNHQGIELQSLPHIKLCKPFRMFSVDLSKLIANAKQKVSNKDKGSCSENLFIGDQEGAEDQRTDGFEQTSNVKVSITASGTVTALVYWFNLHLQEDTKNTSDVKIKTVTNASDAHIPSVNLNSTAQNKINCLSKLNAEGGIEIESFASSTSSACLTSASCISSTADLSFRDDTCISRASSKIYKSSPHTGSMPYQTKDFLKAEHKSSDTASAASVFSMDTYNFENIFSTLDPTHHWQQAAVMADPAKEERAVVTGNYLNLQCVMGSSAFNFRIED